jgi:hypothetical protein
MRKINHARFLRSVETDTATTAEVEFALEGEATGNDATNKYVAVLKKNGDNPYRLDRIMKHDASREIDWFDNSAHEAYTDVTSALFGRETSDTHVEFASEVFGETAGDTNEAKSRFVRQLLEHEGVCEDMECRGISSVFKS